MACCQAPRWPFSCQVWWHEVSSICHWNKLIKIFTLVTGGIVFFKTHTVPKAVETIRLYNIFASKSHSIHFPTIWLTRPIFLKLEYFLKNFIRIFVIIDVLNGIIILLGSHWVLISLKVIEFYNYQFKALESPGTY